MFWKHDYGFEGKMKELMDILETKAFVVESMP